VSYGHIIEIDRTKVFDPAAFIDRKWSIWRGAPDGDGKSGPENQDERSLALTWIDLRKVRLENCLARGEDSITGEERRRRLERAGHVRLDAGVFLALFGEFRRCIPPSWREKTNGEITSISFDGTLLRGPDGRRWVLKLYYSDGLLQHDVTGLDGVRWGAANPAAVLPGGAAGLGSRLMHALGWGRAASVKAR